MTKNVTFGGLNILTYFFTRNVPAESRVESCAVVGSREESSVESWAEASTGTRECEADESWTWGSTREVTSDAEDGLVTHKACC